MAADPRSDAPGGQLGTHRAVSQLLFARVPHGLSKLLVSPAPARAPLVGGNLKTMETLAGTRSDLDTAGKILFVEDTGEYLYSIDRMFWHLQRTGKLDRLAGLIVGGFKVKPDDAGEDFGHSLYDIVSERVRPYTYPVCFDFPVGHQKNNYALKYGIPHTLEVQPASVRLTEVSASSLP